MRNFPAHTHTLLLTNQPQGLDNAAVGFKVFLLHVIKHFASSNVQRVHSSFAVLIFLVRGHVRLELLDACRQGNHLDCRRTSVAFAQLKDFHSTLFL
jgi:hypothetical protein